MGGDLGPRLGGEGGGEGELMPQPAAAYDLKLKLRKCSWVSTSRRCWASSTKLASTLGSLALIFASRSMISCGVRLNGGKHGVKEQLCKADS